MKKLALAVFATALIGFGAPANAQTPPPTIKPIPPEDVIECGESDVITVNCQEYYFEAVPPTTPAPATTTTISAQIPPGPLPSTGSGVSPILGMGAALLVGGGLVVVASRRRSSATAH